MGRSFMARGLMAAGIPETIDEGSDVDGTDLGGFNGGAAR